MTRYIKKHVEDLLFYPSKPLMQYPLDCADGGCFFNTSIPSLAQQLYTLSRVACIAVEHEAPRKWIVYFHGNSENLVSLTPYIKDLSQVAQSTVLALEYPGYYVKTDPHTGQEEVPTEEGCFSAGEAFVEHVKRLAPVPVVFLGYSMGCAVALHSALVHKGENFPAVLALLAPFVSAASVKLAQGPLSLRFSFLWSSFDVFPMKTAALQQGHPTIVFGAEKDEVIPPCHSQKMAELSAEHGTSEYHLVTGATHASIRSDEAGVVYPALLKFMDRF